MATKHIPELTATTSPLADNDLIVIEMGDGSGTKKMLFSELCDAVATRSYVNNATYTDANKALDARMGKTLNDSISTINTLVRGKGINTNVDLNTFIEVGRYYCSTNAAAATLTNCPVKNAFVLDVIPVSGGASTANWYTVIQVLWLYTGSKIFIRRVSGTGTSGSFTFGDWCDHTSEKPALERHYINETKIVGYCFKIDRVCMMTITSGANTATAANTVLTTLPEKFRPVYNTEFVDSFGKIRVSISPDGSIKNIEKADSYIRGGCMFLTN